MADIKTHLNNIKGALYGKDVRGSIHDGIDAINKEVENTTGRQVDLENTFDQLVINAGNSNAEIVDARVKNDGTSYSKLGDRLDAVDSQLAHNTNDISNINNKTYEINVLNPPTETGLKPYVVGGDIETNTNNIQAIFDYVGNNGRTFQANDTSGQYTGYNFTVIFPTSEYIFNKTIEIKGRFLNLYGKRAIIKVTDGSFAFSSSGYHAWKLNIEGFSFVKCSGLNQINDNLEAGWTNIDNCWFYYSKEAIHLEKQSSMTNISKCHFYKCERVGYFDLTDSVVMKECWINDIVRHSEEVKEVIINKTRMLIKDTFLIPCGSTHTYTDEIAWIGNYKSIILENCRCSSEPGSMTIVNNYSEYATEASFSPTYVIVKNDQSLSCQYGGMVVRLFKLPNMLQVIDNNITRATSYPVGYANSFDVSVISGISDKVAQNIINVDVRGNIGQTSIRNQIPTELERFRRNDYILNDNNLGLGTNTPQQKLHLRNDGGAIIRFDNSSNDVQVGDYYGGIEFYSNDVSGNANGVRSDIKAIATDKFGGVKLSFRSAKGSSTTLNEIFAIQSDSICLPMNKTISSSTSTGIKGSICWDSNYLYVCVDTNTWKRFKLETW